jgi:hypothetical protein
MQKISISGPAELLAILPFHLGFRPTRSVVLVCFHERRLGLVARLDVCPESDADAVAEQVLPALRAESPGQVMLVGYEDSPGEATALCEALEDAVVSAGIEVTDRLVVRGDRWYGAMCECCPEEGTPLRAEADVPAVAGFVALGRAPLPDRESLAKLVEPLEDAPPWLCDAIREFVDELEWARRLVVAPPGRSFYAPGEAPVDDSELRRLQEESLAAWGRLLKGSWGEAMPAKELPAIVGALRDRHIRDGLVAWLCPGTLGADSFEASLVEALEEHLGPLAPADAGQGTGRPGPRGAARVDTDDNTDDVLARLEALCRAVPAEHATPVLSVLASYAWWCGDGARASVALEQALELEPDHRLCALLRRMVGLGVRAHRASA